MRFSYILFVAFTLINSCDAVSAATGPTKQLKYASDADQNSSSRLLRAHQMEQQDNDDALTKDEERAINLRQIFGARVFSSMYLKIMRSSKFFRLLMFKKWDRYTIEQIKLAIGEAKLNGPRISKMMIDYIQNHRVYKKAIEDMVRSHAYNIDIDSNKAFLFGNKQDKDGFAFVGSGEDGDPFIIRITSPSRIDSSLKFATTSTFTLFHADATFKLGDIGYPVISCGFTDQARAYQLCALFVVSRRTAIEYAECFRSFSQLVRNLRGRQLRIDAVMGGAEDSQFNALAAVPELADATVLMCYFHVLYNVRKKTQHFLPNDRYMLLRSIMDMHYSSSQHDFDLYKERVLEKGRKYTHLTAFAKYFEDEWIKGRFWRWQVYHTPQGFATTNNPCENFNAVIKAFVQRRRFHMRLLLQQLVDLTETLDPKQPVTSEYVAVTTTELVKAACRLMDTNSVTVCKTNSLNCVQVKELLTVYQQDEDETLEDALEDFSVAFGESNASGLDNIPPDAVDLDEDSTNTINTLEELVVSDEGQTGGQSQLLRPCEDEGEEDDLPAKDRKLETKAVK